MFGRAFFLYKKKIMKLKQQNYICRASGGGNFNAENATAIWNGVNGTLASLSLALPGVAQIIASTNGNYIVDNSSDDVVENENSNRNFIIFGLIALVLIIIVVLILARRK